MVYTNRQRLISSSPKPSPSSPPPPSQSSKITDIYIENNNIIIQRQDKKESYPSKTEFNSNMNKYSQTLLASDIIFYISSFIFCLTMFILFKKGDHKKMFSNSMFIYVVFGIVGFALFLSLKTQSYDYPYDAELNNLDNLSEEQMQDIGGKIVSTNKKFKDYNGTLNSSLVFNSICIIVGLIIIFTSKKNKY